MIAAEQALAVRRAAAFDTGRADALAGRPPAARTFASHLRREYRRGFGAVR